MKTLTHRPINLSQTERIISTIGGGILASAGLMRRSPAGIAMALVGGDLLRRGITGHSYAYDTFGVRRIPNGQGSETTSVPYKLGIRVDRSVTINRPRAEVFRFWRNFENLPRFMKNLDSVTETAPDRSHWVVKGPGDRNFEWDALIHNEIPGELIGWRSLPGSDVDTAGSVRFRDKNGGRATRIDVELLYNPPAGTLGAVIASIWGKQPGRQVQEDLERLKQMLEGEWESELGSDQVDRASEMSFPASDSPAY